METVEYLKQIRRFKSMAEHKQNEVNRIDEEIHGIKASVLDPITSSVDSVRKLVSLWINLLKLLVSVGLLWKAISIV